MASGTAQLKALRRSSPARQTSRILIVDHENESCKVARAYLEQRGYAVRTAPTWASAQLLWSEAAPDAAVLDSSLPDGNLQILISRLKAHDPFLPLVVLAKPDCMDRAMEALRLGADHILPRPVELPVLAAVIERNLEYQRLRRRDLAETRRLRQQKIDPFVGESDSIRALADLAAKAAVSDCPTLIEGERGTGKKSLALWLHQNSLRASEPLIELHWSELSRGLFKTQALENDGRSFENEAQSQSSALVLAHRGTALIKDIQRTDLETQSRLLQFFAGKARGGPAHSSWNTDVRVIAATQENISTLVQAKQFRADLYTRISGLALRIPPLRERRDDLYLIAAQILSYLARDLGNGDFDLTRGALQVLQGYSWPGNIRELRSVLERSVLATRSTLLTATHLQVDGQSRQRLAPGTQFRSLETLERQYIAEVLHAAGGRVQVAAKILGVPRSSLYHKLKHYQAEQRCGT
jgi:DNA-binding NtrC family response regulator